MLRVVHDGRHVRELLVGDLRERFGRQYEIESHPDADSALQGWAGTRRRGER